MRRLAPGFSPISAFQDPTQADFDALSTLWPVGEAFYVEYDGAVPAGWEILNEAVILKMARPSGPLEIPSGTSITKLDHSHVGQATALAELTQPGPFGPRTIEMGDYFGIFEGGELVSMCGERLRVPGKREVSVVCTHPDHQGRGYAQHLMSVVVAGMIGRGEMPFLHVLSSNGATRKLYEKLGFQNGVETLFRILVRT